VTDRQYDWVGSFLLVISLSAYALALTMSRGGSVLARISLLVGAGLGATLFWRTEMRAAAPLVPVATLRDPMLRSSLVASALVATVMMATLVIGPFYLSRALGLGPARVGLAMSVGPLITALCGVPAGRMVDRMGAARMTLSGLVAIVAGTLLLSSLPAAWGVMGYVVPLGIATAGYAVFQTANNAEVMANALEGQRGVIAGLFNLARNLGLITGASAMGAVFAIATHATDISNAAPAAVISGMRLTYLVGAALIVGATVAAASAQRFARPRAPATFAARDGLAVRDSM
jgi:MFS family permease